MMLKYFDQYTEIGLKVIPVYPKSKVPVGFAWNDIYDTAKSRKLIATGRYNMGLLLGDIVDVEGDSDEGNELLNRLIDGAKHPMYRSSRSIHHLFVNPDNTLQTCRFFDIEFRAHGAQSVIPPSIHEDGAAYRWIADSVWPIPVMPEALLNFYGQHRKIHRPEVIAVKPKTRPGVIKTTCKVCNKREFMHQNRLAVEVRAFQELGIPWMCHGCREVDIRPACRRLRKVVQSENRSSRKADAFSTS